jgi:hypothetical protein
VVSETLPEHILDDIWCKLQLSESAKLVEVTNAHPNVALSIRSMQFDNYSMADLCFLIPSGTSEPDDIPITLVYCNKRITCKDAVDQLHMWAEAEGIATNCIVFYHTKIGDKRKCELEEKLRKGDIKVLSALTLLGWYAQFPTPLHCTEANKAIRVVICITSHVLCCGAYHPHFVHLFKEQVMQVMTSELFERQF